MSGSETKKEDYSAQLAKLKAQISRNSGSSDTSKSQKFEIDLASACRQAIKSGDYESAKEMALEKINSDPFAQRIVINELITAFNNKTKKVNEVITAFKALTKKHITVIAFYLFMADIYRQYKQLDAAEQTLSLIEIHNKSEESIRVRDKFINRLKTENRIVTFEVSDDVTDFIVIGKKALRVRNSILPRVPSQNPVDDSDTDEKHEEQRGKPPKKQKLLPPKRAVTFRESENEKPIPETPAQKPQNLKSRQSSIRTPGPGGSFVTREKRSSSITVNGTQYEIFEKLGQGGFSKVYKCMHAETKDVQAVKYVDLSKVDQTSEEGILNEIEHLKNLKGAKNIIQMYNYEIRDRKLFIVIEYGELDCSKYLHLHRDSLDPTMIKCLWRQMVNAVASVHERGIIHRDLKPSNFLICKGAIKLIDFGIANKIAPDVTSMETDMVGTLNYMSPEQLLETDEGSKAAKVGKWADSWSLGCILYLMAYGKLPFEEFKNTHMKVAKIVDENHEIDFPSHRCLGLVAMLKNCLDRRPKERLRPAEILTSFFYNENLSELVKFLNDDQVQELYKTLKRLM